MRYHKYKRYIRESMNVPFTKVFGDPSICRLSSMLQLKKLASNAFVIFFEENYHGKCVFSLKSSENQRFFGDFRGMEVD